MQTISDEIIDGQLPRTERVKRRKGGTSRENLKKTSEKEWGLTRLVRSLSM